MILIFGILAIVCLILNGPVHETPPRQDATQDKED